MQCIDDMSRFILDLCNVYYMMYVNVHVFVWPVLVLLLFLRSVTSIHDFEKMFPTERCIAKVLRTRHVPDEEHITTNVA